MPIGISTAPSWPVLNKNVEPKRKAGHQTLQVMVEHVPGPAAEERLRRAYDLVLKAAAGRDDDGKKGESAGERDDEGGAVGNV